MKQLMTAGIASKYQYFSGVENFGGVESFSRVESSNSASPELWYWSRMGVRDSDAASDAKKPCTALTMEEIERDADWMAAMAWFSDGETFSDA